MTTLFIVGFLLLTAVVVYFKPKLLLWSVAMAIYLVASYNYEANEAINDVVYWSLVSVFLLITLIGNILPIRMKISKAIFVKAKTVLPSISETEQLALNAGDAWYEKEVFQGKPNFHILHKLKKFELSEEEQRFLEQETEQLCEMIDDWQVTHVDRDLPVDVWNFIRDKGFFGLVINKKYGGKGFSAAGHSEIVMKIATKSVTAAVTVMVPNSLGPGELLYHYGTEEQKDKYLPRLAVGQEIPCFALTGPTAGSDATSIPDKGIVCIAEYHGKQVLGIKLVEVNKRYITLAPVATLVGLAFQLTDPDGLLKGIGRVGITCVLLPHDHPGLEIGNRLLPLDNVFMNGTVRIKEAFIPINWIIGGQRMAGEGWRMLVECLSIGRAISLPACGTANALLSTVATSAYATVREQFKVAIGSFEGVEDGLAKMGGTAYMMNATRQLTVAAVDAGVRPSVASAISKYHLTENGRMIINWAMDIHAGRGIIMGPNNYLGRAYQGTPVGITVEGANIMTRNLMIFGQGAMRCHPYIRTIYESLMDNNGLHDFDKAIFGHMGYFAQNMVRAVFQGITAGLFAQGYSSKYNSYYKRITRLSSAFALVNDTALLILGGELKRRERLSARLGDVMSYLYMACATLKYYADNGSKEADDVFIRWSLEHCLYNGQTALDEVLTNFPSGFLGGLYKFMLFPYGLPFNKPSDKLEHKIAKALIEDGETRQSFKKACYVPEKINDPLGRVEIAFQAVRETFAIKNKISAAIRTKQLPKANIVKNASKALELGIINQEEFDKLQLAAKYTNDVIQVDEFDSYELGPKNAHPQWQQTITKVKEVINS